MFNTSMTFPPHESRGEVESSSIAVKEINRADPTEYDIMIEVGLQEPNVHGMIKYWPSFLSPDQATGLARTFSLAFSQIISHPQRSIHEVDLMSVTDTNKLVEWNRQEPEDSDQCVHERIQDVSRRQPNALAIEAWDGQWTYEELDRVSSKLALKLQAQAVGPEVFVAVCMVKSRWTAVAILGVMKAGGAFALMDPSHPVDRQRHMCSQLHSSLVLTLPEQAIVAQKLDRAVVVVGEDLLELPSPNTEIVRSGVTSRNALYAVFTSGSTGSPKGVVIEHHSFCASMAATIEASDMRPEDRVFQFASYSFDNSVFDHLVALLAGARLCIASEQQCRNELAASMARFQTTWVIITPSVARLVAPTEVPSLRTLCLTGEAVTISDLQTWAPAVQLLNLYGPAECSIITSTQRCTEATADPTIIGNALRSVAAWIVAPDNHDRLVPVGGIGELLVEGPGVGRGYLHHDDPRKPTLPFLTDPQWLSGFRAGTGHRLYKTGDLVQYTATGKLRYIGRKDAQVKISGQRVELGEIESAIRAFFSGSHETIVDVVPRPGGKPVLVACLDYYCSSVQDNSGDFISHADSGFIARVAELSSNLHNVLPPFMVPSIFLPLRYIPLAPSGKTDRKSLRRALVELSADDLENRANPRTERPPIVTQEEHQLQALLSQVFQLPLDNIWADSHFFQLGGDSLLAMSLVKAARNAGWQVAVEKIFQQPRLSDLARCIKPVQESDTMSDSIPTFSLLPGDIGDEVAILCKLDRDEIEDIYPSTPMQEGLMALSLRETGKYTAQWVYEIPAVTDIQRLQDAWQAVVDANAIARTHLVPTEAHGVVQVVVHAQNAQIEWVRAANVHSYTRSIQLGQPLLLFGLIYAENGQRPSHMVMTMHHAIYDAVSLSLLLDQVHEAYFGGPLAPRPFNHFVRHNLDHDQERVRQFWAAEFQGLQASVFPPLPVGVTNPTPRSVLKKEVTMARGHDTFGVTMTTIFRTAWAIVLSHHTDSPDVVFGVTASGRSSGMDGIDQVTGPTLATFPLRIQLDTKASGQEVMLRIQDHGAQIIPMEQAGLQNIQRASPEAQTACAFQSHLVVQIPAKKDRDETSLLVERNESLDHSAVSTYALGFICDLSSEDNRTASISAIFDPDVLDGADAGRLLAQFGHVVEQLCTDPRRPVAQIETLSEEDLQTLQKWNGKVPAPYAHTIHALVLQQVARNPHKLAVSSWDGELSYQQLEEASARLAQRLLRLGLEPGTVVPLCFYKGIWPVVAMLAVLRAGGACANIDPKLPAGRITQILKTTQPQMVLTSPERRQFMADALPHKVPIYCIPGIDKEDPETGSLPGELPPARPSDAAFIVFTSGSTGTPKGIVVEHGNLATCIFHTHRALGMTAETRALQFTAYAFDVSLYDTLAPLVLGATTFIPSEETRLSHLGRYIEDHRIDLAMIIPSAVSVIHPAQVPSLQTLVLLGEPITRDVADTWASQVQLINAYGPAESSVVCSAGCIIPNEWRLNTVGPMQGTVGWIVHRGDPSRLMPLGAVGELLLEGPMVTRGYLHDPERTRASYISPPEWLTRFRHGKQSDRLYLTGDLAQLTSQGSIRILGRKDSQVKLHGQRIELEEVESHIRRHWEGAEDVVVEAIQRIQGDHDTTLLVGFVCVNDANESPGSLDNIIAPPSSSFLSSATAARRGLQETLPLYMVPAVLLPLSFMPRSKSGKIDRRCLREAGQALTAEKLREYSSSEDAVEYRQGPVTHAEEALQCLWATVLRVSPGDISRSDNFFHLGGESITAMKLVSLAQREGHSLLVAQVFDNPRLCDMASFIHGLPSGRSVTTAAAPFSLIGNSIERERLLREVGEVSRLPLEQIEDIYPCTPLQEGLVALTSKDPRRYVATTRYNVPRDVDLDRFFSAWQKVSQAHPILRTRIIHDNETGRIFQVVIREPTSWEKHSLEDLADLTYLEVRAEMGSALCRCSLVMDPGSSRPLYVVISMHHAIYDEWSNHVLFTELDQAYRGLSLQHQPFSALVTYQVHSRSAAEDFWAQELALWDQTHFPALPSASYIPSPNSTTTRSVQLPLVSHSLMTVATEIQCAWGLLVSQYTGSRDVIFGLTSSGRGTPVRGIDRVVGPALATSPRRMRIDLAATVPDALRDLQARSIALMPYEHFGVQNIGRLSEPHAHACEFQSLLVIHSASMTEASSGVLAEPTLLSNVAQFSNYGLQLVCVVSQGRIEVHATFDDQVIHPRQMQRILGQFEHLLIQVHGASRSTTIAQLDTISEDDRLELDQWNSFRVFPDQQSCLHDLVQRRCQLQPTALAVCAWDGDLTYEELDLYSSRLAAYLQTRGVGAESFVPLLFEKSRLTVLCQMAVLKAGGAFVLMDPAHPILQAQRLCDELQSILVLTSGTLSNFAEKIGREVITLTADLTNFYEAYDGLEIQKQVTTTGAVYAGYTSGSTGRPKIFVLEHHSVCQAIQALCSSLPVNLQSRVFQFAGYTFDISIMDHFLTLVAGGCLCVPSEWDRRNQLAHTMDRYQVEYACLTTSVLRSLHPRDVPSVKTVVQIGEGMAPDVVDRWSARCRLINAYGPAECALACSLQGRLDPSAEAVNIGTCTTGALWVVDRDDYRRLLPIGAVGELVVEGPQVGRGYMGDPEKTAAAFVELPPWLKRFSGRPAQGARLYRTGDLASIAPDGTLLCLGRQDLQVKLRGQRLDLLAVQHHTLHAFPGARDVMADVVSCGDSQPPALMAFVASESTDGHQNNKVRFLPSSADFSAAVQAGQAQLELELPSYAIPSMFVPIAQMPLNENGKANRRHVALAAARLSTEQLRSYQGTKRSIVAPVTETQRQIRDIWARVLRVAPETISVEDNFFQIGGDSITCMQVASQFQSVGIHASAADIWQYKSVASLVSHCCPDASEPIDETTWDNLSPIQTLFFEQNPSGDDYFNQGFTLQLKVPVSPERVRTAIQRLVEAHSMLRARFQQSQSGLWRQRVTDDSENSFCFKEMCVPDEAALSTMLAVSHEVLDIRKGPLLIGDLIHREDTGQQYLSLVAHHLVVDLVSWWIILADLEDLLRGASTLPPTSTPFMVWCSQQASYAKEHLSPQQALPMVSPDGDGWNPEAAAQYWGLSSCSSNTVAETVEYDFALDAKTTAALMELHTPLVSIIHGCLLHAFAQIFQDRPVPTTFVEGHGREPWDRDIDLTRTVGWFTTLWPAHVSIQHGQLVGDVIRQTHESRCQVPHNGWAYFASRYLNPEGRLAFDNAGPLEFTFNHGGVIQPARESNTILELDSVGMKSRRQARNEMIKFALLEVNSLVFDGSLQVKFEVNRNMKQQDALQRWVRECERSLQEVASQTYLIEANYSLSGHPLVNLATKSLAGTVQDMNISTEDVYPCTPIQRGILLSQLRNPRRYNTLWTIEVRRAHGHAEVDLQRLQRAWTKVVSRHAALRTILVSFPGTDFAHQLVLKDFEPVIPIITNAVHDAASQVQQMTDQREANSWTPTPQAAVFVEGNDRVQIGLSINHVFFDATSIELLVRDLRLAYDGQLSLESPPRYKDFVDHVQKIPSSPAIQYWTDYLHDLQFCHLLPSVQEESRVGQKINDDNPSVGTVSIDLIDSTALQSFCSEHGLLVTNILHVAWALVLRCYTSMDDVCFSFVTSSRDTAVPGIEDCIGFMINHLVARLSIHPSTSVLQLLESNQRVLFNHLEHQNCSLSDVMPLTHSAGRPAFDTAISVRRDLPAFVLPDASTSLQVVDSRIQTEYPFLVDVSLAADQARMSLVYWQSLLPENQAATIAYTFRQVVKEMLRNPSQTIRELDVVPPESKDQIARWNQAPILEMWKLVPAEIMRRMMEAPDAPAVCAWDGSMTYRELDYRSSFLSAYLVEQGAGPEVFIPLCLEKSMWVAVAVCAVLKAGAAFCLLDVSFPPQRLQVMCDQLDATLVLTSAHSLDLARQLGTPVIVSARSGPEDLHNTQVPEYTLVGSPGDAAYAVFTSGSTGKPKAAVIDHQASCASIQGQVLGAKRNSTSRIFQFSSHAFDVASNDFVAAFMTGACLCIPSEEDRVSNMAESARLFEATWMTTTPSVGRLFSPEDVPTLETILVGGETPTEADIAHWGSRYIVAYGPAECCTMDTIRSPVNLEDGTASIGHALPSARTWIVDQHDSNRLMPVGAVGEFLLEGTSIGRGYHREPEKTQQTFIDPPAWRHQLNLPGKVHRFYRTGDLASYLPDGSLRFQGRRDFQVKVRGQRLELADVEHHMAKAFPRALQVVADLITPATGSQKPILMAFIGQEGCQSLPSSSPTLSDNLFMPSSAPFQETVRSALPLLRDWLPAFMIPAVFMQLAAIPMTAGGKVDRRSIRTQATQLENPETASYSTAALSKRAPSNAAEVQLHALVSSVLKLPPDLLGVDDHLLQRGLDSIQAMKLASMAKQRGIALTVPDIFTHPQISALAAVTETVTDKHTGNNDSLSLPGPLVGSSDYERLVTQVSDHSFNRANVEGVLPTTSFQREYLAAKYAAYFVFQFPCALDSARLTLAVQSIVQKYSILRTAFVPFQDTIMQVVLRNAGKPIVELPLDAFDFPAAVWEACQDDCLHPRSSQDLYFQVTLARGPSGQSALLLRLNHAQFDRLSISSLFMDLSVAYSSSLSLRPAPSFSDVLAHRSQLHTPSAFHFWEELLKGSSMTELCYRSSDNPDPATRIDRQRVISFSPAPSQFTMATMHKAAWALTLSRETKSRDLVFGQVASGRNTSQSGIEDALGPCANAVPVRVALQPRWTIKDLLQHIQSQHVRSMEFETVDFEEIVKFSTPWPRESSFGSVIQYQNIPLQSDIQFGDVTATYDTYQFNVPCREPHLTSRFTDDNTLCLYLSVSHLQFDADHADHLLAVFGGMLGLMATDMNELVDNLL